MFAVATVKEKSQVSALLSQMTKVPNDSLPASAAGAKSSCCTVDIEPSWDVQTAVTGQQLRLNCFQYYRKHGHADYIGESVSQLEHACQAAYFAQQNNESTEMIVACFLHDIGHLLELESQSMDGYGVLHHEDLGSAYLRSLGFSELICSVVGNHVKSKRYLVSVKEYYNCLSKASQKTLSFQGKTMSPDEIAAFEREPYFRESLRLRYYDDQAKIVDFKTPPLEHYERLSMDCLLRQHPTAL